MYEPPGVLPSSLLGIEVDTKGGGREYRAYPSLRNVRWLLPAGRPAISRAGIDGLFHPRSLKGKALKAAISRGLFRGERVFLEEGSLGRLEEEFARGLGEPEIRVAFYIGVPGAYRKVTAQVMRSSGETLAFAKIATSPRAIEDVEAEHRVLLRLSGSESLRERVPEALGYFDWGTGRVLSMTGGPVHPGPGELSGVHREFCRDVFLPFAGEAAFGESPMLRRMAETSRRLAPHLPERLATRFDRALELLGEGLGPVRLPLSLAHRDFAPWNTRLGARGLFVFDWDRAEEGTTPLYDVFHFQAIQAVLLKRSEHLPERQFLHGLLDALWPEGREHLPWLYLAYLVDMSLIYSEARVVAPGVGEQGVWRWFTDRVEDFLRQGSPL